MLNTGKILDSALERQHDDSTELRAKAMTWLNDAISMLVVEREWSWLEKSASITIEDDAATLPDDFDRFVFVKTDDWYLEKHQQLTQAEAELSTSDELVIDDDPIPYGFVLTADEIQFKAGCADDTGTLTYIQTVSDYAENATTIIPDRFNRLLVRAVLSAVYEYDEDARTIPSIQLNEKMLSSLKAEENRRKPVPKYGKYLRGRL